MGINSKRDLEHTKVSYLSKYLSCDWIGHHASKFPYASDDSYNEEDHRNKECKKKLYYKEVNCSFDESDGSYRDEVLFIIQDYSEIKNSKSEEDSKIEG